MGFVGSGLYDGGRHRQRISRCRLVVVAKTVIEVTNYECKERCGPCVISSAGKTGSGSRIERAYE